MIYTPVPLLPTGKSARKIDWQMGQPACLASERTRVDVCVCACGCVQGQGVVFLLAGTK